MKHTKKIEVPKLIVSRTRKRCSVDQPIIDCSASDAVDSGESDS